MAILPILVTRETAWKLEIGQYMCINGRACKITEKRLTKGRNYIFAIDIFTGIKREWSVRSHHYFYSQVDVPNVIVKEFLVIDICDDDMTCMDENNEMRTDLKMPGSDPVNSCDSDKELCEEIQRLFDCGEELYVTVFFAMGITAIKSFRVEKILI
jgi:translation elongation factor P/translation initiation factor 5A